MNSTDLKEILSQCEFNLFGDDFQFMVMDKGDGFLLQVVASVRDQSGNESTLKSGKHYISQHAIKDEIVSKAWKACLDFVVHESRNTFKYQGQPIYDPNFLVDELVKFAGSTERAGRPYHNISGILNS
ncbi:MAG: hypothetical protein IH946_06735 [Bacteroidetes bacterium]|nr:hypothetical protein [Bacteroidota bacterium]